MNKIPQGYLIALAAIVIAVWFIISNERYKEPGTTADIVSYCYVNKDRILGFEESLARTGLADSNFFAEYRSRAEEYHFQRMEGDEIGEFFQLDTLAYSAFKNAADNINVKNIWKYPDENFYRLAIRGLEKLDNKKIVVLVLKNKEHTFLPASNSSISLQDTTTSPRQFGNDKSIFVINSRIWIKLNDD